MRLKDLERDQQVEVGDGCLVVTRGLDYINEDFPLKFWGVCELFELPKSNQRRGGIG